MVNTAGGYQWRIQDFSQGGAPTPKSVIIFQFFGRKLHENERIWTPRGARVPGAPPWIRQWIWLTIPPCEKHSHPKRNTPINTATKQVMLKFCSDSICIKFGRNVLTIPCPMPCGPSKTYTLLAMIALSAVQSFAQTITHTMLFCSLTPPKMLDTIKLTG